MNLKINGKDYEILFGFKAIDYLDRVYFIETNGLKLGQGIGFAYNYLLNQQPLALFHAIRAGTITEKQQPSDAEIEAFAMEAGEKDNLEKLYKELANELKKQPLTKATVKTSEKNMKEIMKEQI